MKICVAGKNNIAVNVCQYIKIKHPEIELCIIPNKTDRGCNVFQRSLLWYAQECNIPCVELEDLYDCENLIFLSLEFDRLIIPEKFKSTRLFNVHFSILPKYKGMFTSAMPLLRGEKISGVTFHYIDSGIDTGDIIDQLSFEIDENETAQSLYLKYIECGSAIVIKNLSSLINRTEKSYQQPIIGSSYFSRNSINYADLKLDINQTAWNIDCQIRAFHFRVYQLPKFSGYAILYAILTNDRSKEKPGTILEDTEYYIKISTIDYDMFLYKDKLNELLLASSSGDINYIKTVPDVKVYRSEKEIEHGWTLLMVAVYNNRLDVVRYLVDQGFDVDAQNNNGTTVIMYAKDAAIMYKDTKILSFLMEKQANPYQTDYYGKDLFGYIDEEDVDIANLIRNNEL